MAGLTIIVLIAALVSPIRIAGSVSHVKGGSDEVKNATQHATAPGIWTQRRQDSKSKAGPDSCNEKYYVAGEKYSIGPKNGRCEEEDINGYQNYGWSCDAGTDTTDCDVARVNRALTLGANVKMLDLGKLSNLSDMCASTFADDTECDVMSFFSWQLCESDAIDCAGKTSTDGAEAALAGLWGLAAFFLCITFGCPLCFFLCGPVTRSRRERRQMQQYQDRMHHAVQQHAVGLQEGSTAGEPIDQIQIDGEVGPKIAEKMFAVCTLFCAIIFLIFFFIVLAILSSFDLGAAVDLYGIISPKGDFGTGIVSEKDWGGSQLQNTFASMDADGDKLISGSELARSDYLRDFEYYVPLRFAFLRCDNTLDVDDPARLENCLDLINDEERWALLLPVNRTDAKYIYFIAKLFLLADHVTEASTQLHDLKLNLEELRFFDHVYSKLLIAYSRMAGVQNHDTGIDSGLSMLLIMLVGVPALTFFIRFYYIWGCCGGGGVLRRWSSLPPTAVRVQNEAIVRGHNVEEAILRRTPQPWLEKIFPILVIEDMVFFTCALHLP